MSNWLEGAGMQRRADEVQPPVTRRSDGRAPADADVPLWIGSDAPSLLRELARSLRLHQCVKNLLVFVPVILGGRLSDRAELLNILLAFVALTCVAAGTYLINDIWDRPEDRKHWSKRYRPIAAGRLAAGSALCAALLLIGVGVLLGVLVSGKTAGMLLLYLAV